VSGRLVPRATKVIAVIEAGRPIAQPNISPNYPTTAVTIPMKDNDTMKLGHPFL
jgi:hypothetical protein